MENSEECWCIGEPTASMQSQTAGLAEAVGFRYAIMKSNLRFPWKHLPLEAIPRRPLTFTGFDAARAQTPPPLTISCGVEGIIPSLYLKRKFQERVFSVHILNPLIEARAFDLVVAPRHDGVGGRGVYETMGALHNITPKRLAAARSTDLAARLVAEHASPIVTVLLGGPNSCHDFSHADVAKAISNLISLENSRKVRFVIIPSRRTPVSALAQFVRAFGRSHYIWNGVGENPYLAALAVADYLVVTSDSVSMTSEAAATGKPVFIEHLANVRPNRRFRRFHEEFMGARITRPFDGTLANWRYVIPDDRDRVAAIIKARLS